MVLTELAEDELELDALVATLDPSQVIFVIKGRDQDHGMALFDPAALSGLLEHVTTGRVSRGEIEPREPTNTDATIVADLLDRFLRRIAPELADITDPPSITGFAFSHILRDPSAVEMAFDNILYQRFTLGLDLDNGARQGQMVLIFPCAGTGAGQTKRDQVGNWATDWRQHVERVPVRLEAIFHRKKMALREISELSPGSIIQFPVAQLLHVQLRGTNGTLAPRYQNFRHRIWPDWRGWRPGRGFVRRFRATRPGDPCNASAAGYGSGAAGPVRACGRWCG